MKNLKRFLPRALYILGWLTILLALIRLGAPFVIAARGWGLNRTDLLNYGAAAVTTCGTGLLYMAAARVVELLEKQDDDQP